MKIDRIIRDWLIKVYEDKKIVLEGNLLKVIEPEEDDEQFKSYLIESVERDKDSRRKRLEITKQVQNRNKELLESETEILRINEELKIALKEAESAKKLAEDAKDLALNDLDVLQKKSQTELIGTIVKVALWVILGVGVITTAMYILALFKGIDTQIIGSTWSNMLGILLTNAFSIIGTIMGVKYANQKTREDK